MGVDTEAGFTDVHSCNFLRGTRINGVADGCSGLDWHRCLLLTDIEAGAYWEDNDDTNKSGSGICFQFV